GHAHAMEGPYHVLSVRSVTTSRSGAHPVLTARGAIKVTRWPSGRPTRANPMPLRHWCRFRRTIRYGISTRQRIGLTPLDVGILDDARPFVGFCLQKGRKFGRR